MTFKRIGIALFLSVLFAAFLGAQSVTELAKKEKERRAALKGKTTVVTNKDLDSLKKKPAIETGRTETPAAESLEGAEGAGEEEVPAAAPAVRRAVPREPPPAVELKQKPEDPDSLAARQYEKVKADLQANWESAQERLDLLTLKMNALWQQFYSMDDMTTKDAIQAQISETYEKLLQAEDEEAKAKEALEGFLSGTKKDGVPEIWVR